MIASSTKKDKIIDLGTITFENINSAPAITSFDLNLADTPVDFYFDRFFFNTKTAFDASINTANLVIPDLSITQPLDLSTENKGLLNNNPIGIELLGTTGNKITLDFDVGGGEVNPQNLTQGELSVKALLRKYPN